MGSVDLRILAAQQPRSGLDGARWQQAPAVAQYVLYGGGGPPRVLAAARSPQTRTIRRRLRVVGAVRYLGVTLATRSRSATNVPRCLARLNRSARAVASQRSPVGARRSGRSARRLDRFCRIEDVAPVHVTSCRIFSELPEVAPIDVPSVPSSKALGFVVALLQKVRFRRSPQPWLCPNHGGRRLGGST